MKTKVNGETALERYKQEMAALQADNEQAKREEEENSIHRRYFYHKPKLYLYKTDNQFIPQDKESIKNRLRAQGESDDSIGEILLEIESKNYIPVVYPMQPARPAGAFYSDGFRYIVLNDYYFPYPQGKQGDCSTILQCLNALFGEKQITYFLAWIKGARHRIKECLNTGDFSTASQIMCILGDHDIGKTGIIGKRILRPLFGGNWVPIGDMLKHGKQFNGEMMNSCLLIADDMGQPMGTRARRRMADTMKSIGYAGIYSIEAKGKQALSVRAPWVQILFANDDDSGLESVPDFSGMDDKFIALHARMNASFPANNTDDERKALDAAIEKELPCFAWYVDHYTPPPEIQEPGGRHACKAYVSPTIERLLKPLTDEAKLMNAIDLLIADPGTSDIDTVCHNDGIPAATLQALLRRRGLWKDGDTRAIGRKLARLCKLYPAKIRARRIHDNKTVYVISRSADVLDDE